MSDREAVFWLLATATVVSVLLFLIHLWGPTFVLILLLIVLVTLGPRRINGGPPRPRD